MVHTAQRSQANRLKHREQLALLTKWLKSLKTSFAANQVAATDASLKTAATLMSLAAHNLTPSWLAAECDLRHANMTVDSSRLAKLATRGARNFLSCLSAPDKKHFLNAVEAVFTAQSAELWRDANALGWFTQLLILEDAHRPDQIAVRQKDYLVDTPIEALPALTQWFTPKWIADFLIEETLNPTNELRLIDPACGAGQLLIGALESVSAKSPEQINQFLEDGLVGVDIDRELLETAALGIYLWYRSSVSRESEPPIPKLYYFDSNDPKNNSQLIRSLGSLLFLSDEDSFFLKSWCGEAQEDSVSCASFKNSFHQVVTNPPYLSHRLMPKAMKDFLKRVCPLGQYDLYAAFLKVQEALLAPGGRLSTICQQSFLSIQRYAPLRQNLFNNLSLRTIVQLGSGCFASKSGEKVNNALVTLEKAENSSPSGNIRCLRILSLEEKAQAETNGICSMIWEDFDLKMLQQTFESIEGAPVAFWCPEEIAALFSKFPQLESPEIGLKCVNGLFTCDNKRFVKQRFDLSASESKKYVPYDKGGGQKWLSHTPYMVLWEDNGGEIRQFRQAQGQSKSLPGEDFYFKTGVTYSYIGTRGFKARLLSPNSIFDIASSAIFPSRDDSISALFLLGYLNSALARFMLGVLNPTINFQIGDLRRLPIKRLANETSLAVESLVKQAISLASEKERIDPTSPTFSIVDQLDYGQYFKALEKLNSQEAVIQLAIDEIFFQAFQISQSSREKVLADPWVARNSSSGLGKALSREKYLKTLQSVFDRQ